MRRSLVYVFGSVLLVAAVAVAQSAPSAQGSSDEDEKGVTSYIQFGGSTNSSGRIFKLDTTLGYNFNSHVGVDAGVPLYFAQSSSTSGSGTSNDGVGNPYVDLRLTFKNPAVSYRATVTGFIPVADVKSGLSTGRLTGDWTNQFERSFSRLTPFVAAGIGNTVRDSRFFDRPFTSLGFNAHIEAGSTVALSDHIELGGSGYGIFPHGQQRMYSRVRRMSSGGTTQHGRVFDTTTETVGTADLTRDHGFSGWISADAGSYVRLEFGYTRSVAYDLNTVSFNAGVNLGRLLRAQEKH